MPLKHGKCYTWALQISVKTSAGFFAGSKTNWPLLTAQVQSKKMNLCAQIQTEQGRRFNIICEPLYRNRTNISGIRIRRADHYTKWGFYENSECRHDKLCENIFSFLFRRRRWSWWRIAWGIFLSRKRSIGRSPLFPTCSCLEQKNNSSKDVVRLSELQKSHECISVLRKWSITCWAID